MTIGNAPIPREIQTEIVAALDETLQACKQGRFGELKYISDHTIHTASIFQDQDSISFAIIIFSLFKISQRVKQKKKFGKKITPVIEKLQAKLKKQDFKGYHNRIKQLFDIISKIDEKFKQYIDEVINHAQAKKGTKIHEHGVSIARAAEIIGISHWELMNYVGKTKIPERERVSENILQRMKLARRLFL